MFSITDIVHALRLLKKTPRFTASVIFILAGGLTTALFAFQFVYGLMYKSIPLPDGDSLYRSGVHWHSEANGNAKYFPAWEFSQIKNQIQGVSDIGIWQNKTLHLSMGENAKVVAGVRTQSNVLFASGVQPVKGRLLQPSDSEPGAPAVAVIGYPLWKSQFAGREDVVGQIFKVNGIQTEVVGVMPQGFKFPISHDLWLPISQNLLKPVISNKENVEVFMRLDSGVNAADVETQLGRLVKDAFSQRAAQFPGVEFRRAQVSTFVEYDIGATIRNFLLTLNLIGIFILLLASINTSNLLFARAIQRGKESAIRIAIGATRSRLITQLMWEGVIITVVGTLIAVLITAWVLNVFHVTMHSLMQGELAFWYVWSFDLPTLMATLGFMFFVILVACFIPARRAATQNINSVLRDGTRGAQGRAAGRASRILVTVQIMLITIISLVGAVIVIKVDKIIDADLGLNVSSTYFTMMSVPNHDYPEPKDQAQFYDNLRRRLDNAPEVVSSYVHFVYGNIPLSIEGVEYQTDSDKPKAYVNGVLGSMAINGPNLLEGRELDSRDNEGNRPAAMVSASFAKRHWPGESALNKQFSIKINQQQHKFNVVGVVSDIAVSAFRPKDQRDEVYLSGMQMPMSHATIFFRYSSDGYSAENAFFDALASIDTGIDILTIEEYEGEINAIEKMARGVRDTIIYAGLFSLFLAISGIYSLTSYAITRRTHEIGLRRAIGAMNGQIVSLFIKQSSWQLGMGVGIGVIFTALLFVVVGKILALPTIIYLIVYAVVILTLVLAVLSAVVIPVRAALKHYPAESLRFE